MYHGDTRGDLTSKSVYEFGSCTNMHASNLLVQLEVAVGCPPRYSPTTIAMERLFHTLRQTWNSEHRTVKGRPMES